MIDLSKLSTKEILEQTKEFEREVSKRRKADLQQAYKDINQLAKEYGFTLDEVLEEGKPKKLPMKYKDPKTKNEWSGYGKQPNWIKAYLEEGKSLDEFLIK